MKVIYRIAKTELSLMFYSPIAWLVLIIFATQLGVTWIDLMKVWMKEMASGHNFFAVLWGGIGKIVYGGPIGFLQNILNYVFIYMPMLTMGLISREISSGSIKLLQSSPITNTQIVLGKFGSMLVYCLLLIGIIFLYLVASAISIESFDFKAYVPVLIIYYLLICTYSAIGLYMSSLTSYQIVAVISTFAIFVGINMLPDVGQKFAFIRAMTYSMFLAGHAVNAGNGLLSSKDFLYFILTIILFLLLTIIRLNDKREIRPVLVKVARYVSVIVIYLGLVYMISSPYLAGYIDMTANKNQTLSPNTQEIIKKIKGPLTITTYSNLLADNPEVAFPILRSSDYRFWEPYMRFKPDIQFNYVLYYDTSGGFVWYPPENAKLNVQQLAKKLAYAYGMNLKDLISPGEMKKQIDFSPEEHRVLRILEADGKKSTLRTFWDSKARPYPDEHEIAASLRGLIDEPSRIGFSMGHHERDITKMEESQYFRLVEPGFGKSLINQGFLIDSVFLEYQDIPRSIVALVIADPKRAFSNPELEKIQRYVDGGGNMLIAGEPGRQDILNPVLSKLGVRFMDGVLIQSENDSGTMKTHNGFTFKSTAKSGPEEMTFDFSANVRDYFNADKLKNPMTDTLYKISTKGAVGIEYKDTNGFKTDPILVTNKKTTWNKMGAFSPDTSVATYNPEKGDTREMMPVGLAMTRKVAGKEQRIVVMGDADFMSVFYSQDLGTVALLREMFKWLNNSESPVDTDPPLVKDLRFRATKNDLPVMRFTFFGLLPGILLISSMVILIRRKRK